jgi:hypothetical protein
MAQTYTDNCFAPGNVGQTDLGHMEENFAALKSSFSGTTPPSNTVAGMLWLDTTANILKLRNEANNAWLSVWDIANNKPVITNLSAEITLAMMAAACIDAAAGTPSLRTLSTTATTACAGNDARLSDTRTPFDLSVTEGKLGASAVTQAKLKTSQASVNITKTASYGDSLAISENCTLPGGEYGFYPQFKQVLSGDSTTAAMQAYFVYGFVGTTYLARVHLAQTGAADYGDATLTTYAQQRYVTSSGEVFWIFILRDKLTKQIVSMYQAPDHPCFGNGGKPLLVPHPFPDFNPEQHEIIVINPSDEDVFNMEDACIVEDETKPDRDMLEVITEDYEIDEDLQTPWPKKEITVGLPRGLDWKRNTGETVIPVKKKIPKMDYITTRKLWKRK